MMQFLNQIYKYILAVLSPCSAMQILIEQRRIEDGLAADSFLAFTSRTADE